MGSSSSSSKLKLEFGSATSEVIHEVAVVPTAKCIFYKMCKNRAVSESYTCTLCMERYGQSWVYYIRQLALNATAKYYIEWEPDDLAKLLTEANVITDIARFKTTFFPIGSVIPNKDDTCTAKFEMFELYHLKLYQLIYPPDDSIQPYTAEKTRLLIDNRNQKLARLYFEARECTEMATAAATVATNKKCTKSQVEMLNNASVKKFKDSIRRLEKAENYMVYLSDKQPPDFKVVVQSLLLEMIRVKSKDWEEYYEEATQIPKPYT